MRTNRRTQTAGKTPKFFFRQHALQKSTGKTLRPGGIRLTGTAVDLCGLNTGDRVLDAGCGYGTTARYLADNHGIASIGLDLAFDMLEQARNDGCGRIPCVNARLPLLPFRSNAFHAVFSECVLSLIPDKQTCLDEFYRILKQNGRLVLADLYIPEAFAPRAAGFQKPEHITSCLDGALPAADLIRLLQQAGFTVDRVQDRTEALKQLAGQLVFDHGSLDCFWETAGAFLIDQNVSEACRSGCLKPGYHMVVASKTTG